jgi:hypothetical protein
VGAGFAESDELGHPAKPGALAIRIALRKVWFFSPRYTADSNGKHEGRAMRNFPVNIKYPFFWGPEEHCLSDYYRQLNRWFYILSPLVFLVNEFFIRPGLVGYKETSNSIGSILALTLNAQIPLGQGMPVIGAIATYSLCLAINFVMLPKWGGRPSKAAMKSGLPIDDEYKGAFFYITNPIQKNAFVCWNAISIRISFFFASFIPCMGINLFRSL